jgi:hypothetical protein
MLGKFWLAWHLWISPSGQILRRTCLTESRNFIRPTNLECADPGILSAQINEVVKLLCRLRQRAGEEVPITREYSLGSQDAGAIKSFLAAYIKAQPCVNLILFCMLSSPRGDPNCHERLFPPLRVLPETVVVLLALVVSDC